MKKADVLKAKLTARIAAMTTARLTEMAELLNTRFDDDANTVLEEVMRELERRMPKSEYVAMCEKMEAALDAA